VKDSGTMHQSNASYWL